MPGKAHISLLADGRIDRGLWPGARTSHHVCGSAEITPPLLFASFSRSDRPVVMYVMKAPSVCFRNNFQLKKINAELTSEILSTYPKFQPRNEVNRRLLRLERHLWAHCAEPLGVHHLECYPIDNPYYRHSVSR